MHHRYQRHRWQICRRCQCQWLQNCRRYQRDRRQMCHRYQRHRRQILPTVSLVLLTVLRIHVILGWIRIRILGSMPLTNGSGSGSATPVVDTGGNDTGGKFAACFNDTGGNLPPVSTTAAANLPPVSMTPVANNGNNMRLLRP